MEPEALRRWLELQKDLGGDEIILDPLVNLGEMLKRRPASRVEVNGNPDTSPRSSEIPAQSAPDRWPRRGEIYPDGAPEFLQDAPEIPAAGLRIKAVGMIDPARAALASLEDVAAGIAQCQRCRLCQTRTYTVPGEGNPQARLMVIGEGPGEQEDLTGRPFVGRAGELLDRMLLAIGEPREQVYIANVVKCRPPANRAPLPDEREACFPWLQRQITLVRPKVILALGGTAAETLLGVKKTLGELRLKVHRWEDFPLVVTYHPAALLRNPNWKRPAWDDVRIVRQLLDALS